MKRDLELVRQILLSIEARTTVTDWIFAPDLKLTNWTNDEINYNLLILLESGYLKGNTQSYDNQVHVYVHRLTWEGHEFLDAARDDARWKKAASFAEKAGGIAFEVLKPILIDMAGQAFRTSLGLPPS